MPIKGMIFAVFIIIGVMMHNGAPMTTAVGFRIHVSDAVMTAATPYRCLHLDHQTHSGNGHGPRRTAAALIPTMCLEAKCSFNHVECFFNVNFPRRRQPPHQEKTVDLRPLRTELVYGRCLAGV